METETTVTLPPPKTSKLVKMWRKNYMPICVLTPVIMIFAVFSLFPAIYSLFLSFTDYTMKSHPNFNFIGFENWERVLTDDRIWLAMRITVQYTLMYVPLTMALGMALAFLINKERKGIRFFRVVYFLPSITSAVVLSAVWGSFFISTPSGLMNTILGLFGISPVGWMTNTSYTLPIVASLGVFMGAGGLMIFYLGGMKGISQELYESATIDGAGKWVSFWKITIPLLKPTILYTLVMSTIGSFQVFDAIHVMTQGGPAGSTTTIVYSLFRSAFIEFRLGYASTIGFLLFFIVGTIAFIQYKFLGKDVSYE